MSHAIKIVTLIDIMFLILLMLSASFTGVISSIIYTLSFLIPFAIGFAYSKQLKTKREEELGIAEPLDKFFTLKKSDILSLIPLIAPAITIIFFIAALTSLILTALGAVNSQPENVPLIEMLIVHALAPAILEELLFRYIPMKLLFPYSPRYCVLLSALYFALIHANLFQMPYAFAAGIIFMVLNLAFDSVLPSLILHFTNNVLSVICMKYCLDYGSIIAFAVVLLLFALISLIFIVKRRYHYSSCAKKAFSKGDSFTMNNAPIALIVISLYIALMNLFV